MKDGTKTTEFWISISPVLAGLVEGMRGDPENNKFLIVCGSVLACFYISSRTLLKLKLKSTVAK